MQEPGNNDTSTLVERTDKKTTFDRLWNLVIAVFTVFFAKAVSDNHLMKAGVLAIGASLILLIGAFWEGLKGRTQRGFTSLIRSVATDPRIRSRVRLFLLFLFVGYTFSSFYALRNDLNAYVMPRKLSDRQVAEIQRVLSAHNSDITVDILVNPADQEALTYAAEISRAIISGGWNTRLVPFNPWDVTNPGLSGSRIYIPNALVDKGVSIQTCILGQPKNPDPKHPTDDGVLQEALMDAQIAMGSGMKADCQLYSITIVVGGRPWGAQYREPVLSRFGRWLEKLGRQNS